MRKKKIGKNKLLFISFIVIVLILVFIKYKFSGDSSEKLAKLLEEEGAMIYCKNDINGFNQFVKNSETCLPSKITCEDYLNFYGVISKSTTYYEIKRKESDNCVLYLENKDVSFDYSETLIRYLLSQGETEEKINNDLKNGRDIALSQKGKYGDCKFKTNELNSMLNSRKEGTFSISDFDNAECEGSLSYGSYIQHNNPNCKLQFDTNIYYGKEITLSVGSGWGLEVTGFDKEEDISWEIKDMNIATITKEEKYTMLKGKNVGSTILVITDKNIGNDCNITMPIEVVEQGTEGISI